MFFGPDVDWPNLEPIDILVLRACAPSGVFTPAARGGYLTRVGGDEDRSEIADAMFATDFEFIDKLPPAWQKVKQELITLMQLAYRKGIRPLDSRVKSM